MAPRNSNKIANGLVAMSSGAVLAVYAAGYVRTQSAADLLQGQSTERRRPTVRTPVAEQTAVPAAAAISIEAPAPVKPNVTLARVEVAKPKPVEVASVDSAPA